MTELSLKKSSTVPSKVSETYMGTQIPLYLKHIRKETYMTVGVSTT